MVTVPEDQGSGGVTPFARVARPSAPARRRTTPVQFVREIRDEMRQVAWPNRSEMLNYSAVVFIILVLMIALIFVLNLVFGKGIFYLFQR